MERRAILSVSNKKGIVELGQVLDELGFALISTGGTARTLEEAGLKPIPVAEVTGFPEILGGRVKTLHPAILGGILARRTSEHLEELASHSIAPLDLVVVNLYPFEEASRRPGITLAEAIEEIDIGGVTLLRAAAKNFAHVGVVVDPADYQRLVSELKAGGELSLEMRKGLALKAFRHTARYDALISAYLAGEERFPQLLSLPLEKVQDLRYGENPHQKAAFYRILGEPGLPNARQLQGRALSFNNLQDLEAAWNSALEFRDMAAVVIKHANPCGIACAQTLEEAYRQARACDPQAPYGSIVGLNRRVDEATARAVLERSIAVEGLGKVRTFVEAVIAPAYDEAALKRFSRRPDLRVLQADPAESPKGRLEFRPVRGGMLLQERDELLLAGEPKIVTKRAPTAEERKSLLFAWQAVKLVKSNAIVLARGTRTVGIGAGQMKRVDATRIALSIAGRRAQGAVLGSDAFIPFPDNIEEAAQAGVTAFIQTGGSARDGECIAAADSLGCAMLFTATRHFRH